MKSFLTSSSDPAKVSMFLKSLAVLGVLFGLDTTLLEALQVEILNLVAATGMIVSAGTAVYGLARKLYLGRWSAK